MTWFAVGAAAVSAANNRNQQKANDVSSGILMDANQYSIDERRRQFDANRELRLPFYDAGVSQLPMLDSQATGQGYSNAISQLLQGGRLNPMIEQDQLNTRRMLSGIGASRSGYGASQMAAAPSNVAIGLENQLNQRGQALAGFGQTAGLNFGSAGQANSSAIAALLQGQGNITANNINANRQAQQDFSQNIMDLGASFAGNRAG